MERHSWVFVRDGDWWVGYVEDLPGAHTQGRTLEEARDNLEDAVRMIREVNRDLARSFLAGEPEDRP